MLDDASVAEMVDIAASPAPLLERAQQLVQSLERWAPSDAAWLALAVPGSKAYARIGSRGLDQSVLDYLDRPSVAQEIELAGLNRNRLPVSMGELSIDLEDQPTW